MATFVLANDINVSGTRMRAGKLISDTVYVIATLQLAGAILVPVTTQVTARSKVLQSKSKSGQDPTFENATRFDTIDPFVPAAGGTLAGDVTGPVATNTVVNLTGAAGVVTVSAATSMAFGTNPAASGLIRLPNNTTISARNPGNTADRTLITLSASDGVVIGDAASTGPTNLLAGSTIGINSSSNANAGINLQSGSSGAIVLTAGGASLRVDSTNTLTLTPNGHGVIILNGAQRVNTVSKGAAYTADSTLSDYAILLTGTANAQTLPPATAGRVVVYKDSAGNAAAQNKTLTPAAGTIDGAATYVLNVNNGAIVLLSDGANWFVIGSYNGTVI
jgi:hypothetical protein